MLAEDLRSIGQFRLRWRRVGRTNAETEAVWATTIVDLPGIVVEREPVKIVASKFASRDIEMSFAAISHLRFFSLFPDPLPQIPKQNVPFQLSYTFTNTSAEPQSISVSMGTSDAVVFSGPKTVTFQLGSRTTKTLEYSTFPLRSGNLTLPRLKVLATEGNLERTTPLPRTPLPATPATPMDAASGILPGRPSLGLPESARGSPLPSPDPTGRNSMSLSRTSLDKSSESDAAIGREIKVLGQNGDDGVKVFVMPNSVRKGKENALPPAVLA